MYGPRLMNCLEGFVMTRRAIGAAVLALALSAAAAPMSAQAIVSSPGRFGILGGGAVPRSELEDGAKDGVDAGGVVAEVVGRGGPGSAAGRTCV